MWHESILPSPFMPPLPHPTFFSLGWTEETSQLFSQILGHMLGEPQQHTDQPSELRWISGADKLFSYPLCRHHLTGTWLYHLYHNSWLGVLQRRRGCPCQNPASPSVCQSVAQLNASEAKTSLTFQTHESPGLCLSSEAKKTIFRLNIILYRLQVSDGQLWLVNAWPTVAITISLLLVSHWFYPKQFIWTFSEGNSCYFSETCFCCCQLF